MRKITRRPLPLKPAPWSSTETRAVKTPRGYLRNLSTTLTPDADPAGVSRVRRLESYFSEYDEMMMDVVTSLNDTNHARFEAGEARKAVPFSCPSINFSPEEIKLLPGESYSLFEWRVKPLTTMQHARQMLSALLVEEVRSLVAAEPSIVSEAAKYETQSYSGAPFYESDPAAHAACDAIIAMSSSFREALAWAGHVDKALECDIGDELPAAYLVRVQEFARHKPIINYAYKGGLQQVEEVYGGARRRKVAAVSHVINEPIRIIANLSLKALKRLCPGMDHTTLQQRTEKIDRLIPEKRKRRAADLPRFDRNNSRDALLIWEDIPALADAIGLSRLHGELAFDAWLYCIDADTLCPSTSTAGQACLRADAGLKSGAILTSAQSNRLIATFVLEVGIRRGVVRRGDLESARSWLKTAGVLWYGDNILADQDLTEVMISVFSDGGFFLEFEEGEELLRGYAGALYVARAVHRSFFSERVKRRGAWELGTGVRCMGLERHPFGAQAWQFVRRQLVANGHPAPETPEKMMRLGIEMLGAQLAAEALEYQYSGLLTPELELAAVSARSRVPWSSPMDALAYYVRTRGYDLKTFYSSARHLVMKGSRVKRENTGLY